MFLGLVCCMYGVSITYSLYKSEASQPVKSDKLEPYAMPWSVYHNVVEFIARRKFFHCQANFDYLKAMLSSKEADVCFACIVKTTSIYFEEYNTNSDKKAKKENDTKDMTEKGENVTNSGGKKLKECATFIWIIIPLHYVTAYTIAFLLYCVVMLIRNGGFMIILTFIVMLNVTIFILSCFHAEVNYHYFWDNSETTYLSLFWLGVLIEAVPQ